MCALQAVNFVSCQLLHNLWKTIPFKLESQYFLVSVHIRLRNELIVNGVG